MSVLCSIVYSSVHKSLELTIFVFLGVEFIVSFFMPHKFTEHLFCEKYCAGPGDSVLIRQTLATPKTQKWNPNPVLPPTCTTREPFLWINRWQLKLKVSQCLGTGKLGWNDKRNLSFWVPHLQWLFPRPWKGSQQRFIWLYTFVKFTRAIYFNHNCLKSPSFSTLTSPITLPLGFSDPPL